MSHLLRCDFYDDHYFLNYFVKNHFLSICVLHQEAVSDVKNRLSFTTLLIVRSLI